MFMRPSQGPDSVFGEESESRGMPQTTSIHARRKRVRLLERMRQISRGSLGNPVEAIAEDEESYKETRRSQSSERGHDHMKLLSQESGDSGLGLAFSSVSSSGRRHMSTDSTDSTCFPIQRQPVDSTDSALQLGYSSSSKLSSVDPANKKTLEFRVLVMGPVRSGKTSILSQFLYDQFFCEHNETIDEMYRGEFDLGGCNIALNIEDTGGSYSDEFRTMADLSLAASDAVILVYSLTEPDSIDELSQLRDLVLATRGSDIPIVVAANKCELGPQIGKEEAKMKVEWDWETRFVECSAKDNINITELFKTLLVEVINKKKLPEVIVQSLYAKGTNFNRRQSLPQIPSFARQDSFRGDRMKFSESRKKQMSEVARKKDSCTIS